MDILAGAIAGPLLIQCQAPYIAAAHHRSEKCRQNYKQSPDCHQIHSASPQPGYPSFSLLDFGSLLPVSAAVADRRAVSHFAGRRAGRGGPEPAAGRNIWCQCQWSLLVLCPPGPEGIDAPYVGERSAGQQFVTWHPVSMHGLPAKRPPADHRGIQHT